MCGITGYINRDKKAVKDTGIILNMLKAQKHRGPDDTGIRAFSLKTGTSLEINAESPKVINGFFEGILGFNRLSILDLSMNGHQPMMSSDGRVILALNGEIYNAFDFKDELYSGGYRFKSTTDTEIVLALYLKYGFNKTLALLNGMFAIIIIDLDLQEMFVARDRFGIKPMYYIDNGLSFAFSSELKSFKYINDFIFQLDHKQLDEYLLFRNNLNGTLFKDIQSLSPGHYLSFTHDSGLIRKKYFDINAYTRTSSINGDIDYYCNNLEGLLGQSVRMQLMSDVKLGCQLSGGVDSSLVTWLANRNSQKGNFEGVSIIFNDSRFSEEEYINIASTKLGVHTHKFLLDSDYYLDNIENASWHLEAPINHPNTIGIYKLSQRAKDYVTVLLSGEGADEVFGGYDWFYDTAFPFSGRRFLHEIKSNLTNPINLYNYFDPIFRSVMATSFTTSDLAGKLYSNFKLDRAIAGRKELYSNLSGSAFDKQVKYEIQVYMPDLLIRQDKMSMAHSIENRVPFLDNNLVEKSFLIPEKYLLQRNAYEGVNTQKYLLKKVASKTFGHDFAFRNKMGFGIPLREFFLKENFNEYLLDKVLPGIKSRGLFNDHLVASWIRDVKRLKYYEVEALWVMISFEIWASKFLDIYNENSYTSH